MFYYIFFSLIFLTNVSFATNKIQDPKIAYYVQTLLHEHVNKFQIPGVAVALYYDDAEYLLSYGFADKEKKINVTPDTLFKLASVTKVFTTSLLALKLLQEKIQLQDPVSRYLNIKQNDSFQDINDVTLLHLATHTSSLPRVFPNFKNGTNYTEEKIIHFLKNWKASRKIGTHYYYSNLGFGVLGMALAKQNHSSYMDLLRDFILKPLNMNQTTIAVKKSDLPLVAVGYNEGTAVPITPINTLTPGSGALYSTARDMMNFLKANLGVYGPINIINAMEYAQKSYFTVNQNLTMGLGWQRFTNDSNLLIIDKNGGLPGFSSYIGFIKGPKKIGIVILTNKRGVNDTELGRKILSELHSK